VIRFTCKNCGQKIKVHDQYAGKKGKCPKCRQAIVVPAAAQQPPAQSSIVKFRCPHCSQKIGLPADYAGKQVRCAKCRKPFRVPQSSPAASAAVITERPAMSQKPSGEPPSIWDQLDGMEELRIAESTAPAVGRAPEQPQGDYGSGGASYDAQLPASGAVLPSASAPRRPGKKRSALVVGLSCLLIVLVSVVIAWFVAGPGGGGDGDVDSAQAQELAEQFIYLLSDQKTSSAKELLADRLRDSVKDEQMIKLAKRVGQGEIANLSCLATHFERESEAVKHYLWYGLERGGRTLNVIVTVADEGGLLGISGIGTDPYSGDSVTIGSSSYEDLQATVLAKAFGGFASIFARYACAFGIVILTIAIIQIVSAWVVYEKAGKPGWAAIVPIYNFWVLAEVADRPGWWGLNLCFSGIIPFVGPIIQTVFWIVISVGVARTFNRGVLFGLGLFLLPFVFYPILAFGND